MDTIAIYNEKTIKGCRKFELFEDKIVLYADFLFASKSELTIPLKNIKLDPDKIFIKTFNSFFQITGCCILITSLFLVFILHDKTKGYSGYFPLGGFIIFIIMLLIDPKRNEYSSFAYNSGTDAFDVGYIGKYKKDYPQFIELIKQQIKKTNTKQINP